MATSNSLIAALQPFAMVCLTVPHEHLPAGAVGVVLDIYGDAAHVQFRETVCPDGFSEALADLVIVPLAHLRPAEASDYPAEPMPAPMTADEAMEAWADADNPQAMSEAVEAAGLTIEEQISAACSNVGYITLDFEAGEMMELMRSDEGRAEVSAAIDEAVSRSGER